MTHGFDRHRVSLIAVVLACAALTLVFGVQRVLGGGSLVAQTRHNLTASGPGELRTDRGGEVCVFCHTPHAANPVAPLWNRQDPGSYYDTYDSTTLNAEVGQPTGSSRLCLSCHDGTIALTQTYNSRNMPVSSLHISESDRGYIGTDLSDDHPISFHYSATLAAQQGQLKSPDALPSQLPLDHNNQLQCTTCHDPHDDTNGRFLRMANSQSQMCKSCHQITGWATSKHATSDAAIANATRDTWTNLPDAKTVADAGCESCHRPHSAGGRQRLLRHEAEEDNCLNCHDGSIAKNLVTPLNKMSRHTVSDTINVHQPNESPLTMTKHVECADCHSPHTTGAPGVAKAPFIRPAMAGASGLTRTGSVVAKATYEYQVCYKCHSQKNFAEAVVTRTQGNDNIADEFVSTNASYHPVEAIARPSINVPSLLQGYDKKNTIIYCTDCHTADSGSTKGPHGSAFRPLLAANYSVTDNTGESPTAYALCYKCHNRKSITEDESFKRHHLHIADEKAPCSACHDPHGVKNATHLINFDSSIVTKTQSTGQGPTFTDLGDRRGSCTLRCHGFDHVNEDY